MLPFFVLFPKNLPNTFQAFFKMSKPTIYLNDSFIKNDGTAALYLRVYLVGKYVKLNIDIDVNPEFWDKEHETITGGDRRKEKNLQIKECLGRAADILLKYQVQKKKLTRELFSKEFQNPSVVTSFYDFMTDQIKSRHDLTESTKKSQLGIVIKMRKMRESLLISEIDDNYLSEYHKHWTKKGNKKTTLATDFKIIKTYINRAIKLQLLGKSPFEYFKVKRELTFPVFLTEDERDKLVKLYDSKYLPDKYQKTLRQFLFSCYTGLRVSDIKAIKYENIEYNRLTFKPKKTLNVNQNQITMPLSNRSLRFIEDEKKGNELVRGIIFNEYVEQKLNSHLKDIAKVAKIDKSISMHVARHTFATLFLKKTKSANGILILQKLLGHSTLQSTMVYSHVITSDLDEAMSNFD